MPKFKLRNLLLLGGAAYGMYYLITGQKLQNLILKLGEIARVKIGLPNSFIYLNLYVTNPNSKDLVYNEFFGTMLFNGKPIANIRHAANVLLPGKNATTTIQNITIELSTMQVINNILDTIKSGGIVTINGTVVADKLSFPIKQEVKLTKAVK